MKDKFLVVKLDQYAGNVDEIVCVALTGYGGFGHGRAQARKVFDAKVRPLLEDQDDEYPQLPIDFMEFSTEYGSKPYELDSSSTNNLRMCIDGYSTDAMINEMLAIWEQAYSADDGNLVITVDDIHRSSVTVKILGFDLVEISEKRTTLR